MASPTGVTSSPGRYLWFTESAADKIGRLDPGGPIPVNVKLPSITGVAQQGSRITAHPGLWSNNPGQYSYLWQDCDRSGVSCHETNRGLRHLVSARDVGHTIRVFVIARNPGGSSVPAESAPTTLVRGPAERLFLGDSIHRLSLMGSNGYHISLSTYINHNYNRVTLDAEKDGVYASYSVKGVAHNGTIRAIYPDSVGSMCISSQPGSRRWRPSGLPQG